MFKILYILMEIVNSLYEFDFTSELQEWIKFVKRGIAVDAIVK